MGELHEYRGQTFGGGNPSMERQTPIWTNPLLWSIPVVTIALAFGILLKKRRSKRRIRVLGTRDRSVGSSAVAERSVATRFKVLGVRQRDE